MFNLLNNENTVLLLTHSMSGLFHFNYIPLVRISMKPLIHIWDTIESLQRLWLEKDQLKGHRGSIIAVNSKWCTQNTTTSLNTFYCILTPVLPAEPHVLTHSALCLNVVWQLLWTPVIIDFGFVNCAPRPCPEGHWSFCHVVPGGFASTNDGAAL